jgi:hypothetical protein
MRYRRKRERAGKRGDGKDLAHLIPRLNETEGSECSGAGAMIWINR